MTSSLLRFSKVIVASLTATLLSIILIPSAIIWVLGNGKPPIAIPVSSSTTLSKNLLVKQVNTNPSIATQPVRLGWVTGSLSKEDLSAYHGLSVVCPMLVSVTSTGRLVLQQTRVIDTLHRQGVRLWARLTCVQDTPDAVHAFLTDAEKRMSVVEGITDDARIQRWDGVNIDIENVSAPDRALFSAFIQELSKSLHATHLSLSIDIPPDPVLGQNSAEPFDHTVLGQYCDAVILMGYDEHWASDPVPGPVTSMPWIKSDLSDLTTTGIPAQKTILGLPAYTRVWEQNQQGSLIQDPAYSVHYVDEWLTKNHETLIWNPYLDQFYTSYEKNSDTFKIWLAGSKSLKMYLSLVANDHLAGSAIWSLDLMNAQDWNQLFASDSAASQ